MKSKSAASTTSKTDYVIGTKVLLHSWGIGKWFPIEKHTVTKVTKDGIVYIDGLDKVGFKQDGQESEPGAFRFKFYIEIAPTKKPTKRKPTKAKRQVKRK